MHFKLRFIYIQMKFERMYDILLLDVGVSQEALDLAFAPV